MSYNGYGSIAGLEAYSRHSSPSYLGTPYASAYGAYGAHRDVSGAGGYRYRQWDNGDIAILSGTLPGGWSRGAPGPRGSAWNAIYAEIGPYPASSSSSSSSSGGSSSSSSSSSSSTKKDDEPKWYEQATDFVTDIFSKDDDDAPVGPNTPNLIGTGGSSGSSVAAPAKTFPWGWVIGGTVATGAIIAIAVMASKRGK